MNLDQLLLKYNVELPHNLMSHNFVPRYTRCEYCGPDIIDNKCIRGDNHSIYYAFICNECKIISCCFYERIVNGRYLWDNTYVTDGRGLTCNELIIRDIIK